MQILLTAKYVTNFYIRENQKRYRTKCYFRFLSEQIEVDFITMLAVVFDFLKLRMLNSLCKFRASTNWPYSLIQCTQLLCFQTIQQQVKIKVSYGHSVYIKYIKVCHKQFFVSAIYLPHLFTIRKKTKCTQWNDVLWNQIWRDWFFVIKRCGFNIMKKSFKSYKRIKYGTKITVCCLR